MVYMEFEYKIETKTLSVSSTLGADSWYREDCFE